MAGDRMFTIALAWWVVSQADSPDRGFMLGLLLVAGTLPIVLFGALFGRVVDRFSKRSCMMVADAVRMLLVAALGILISQNLLTLPLLFSLCAPVFALEPLFCSAMSASLPALSQSPSMLARLIALERAIPNLGAVMGALFGSIALATYGVEGAVWFNAATFLASFGFVSRLPPLRSSPMAEGQQSGGHRPANTGYKFLKDYRDSTRLLGLFAIINFFITPVYVYLPLLVQDVLKAGGAQLGLLELAFSTGNLLVFGYFLAKPTVILRTRWLRFFLVAMSSLFLYLLGEAKCLWTLSGILMAWGMTIAFVTYLAISSFQRTIPDRFKGRFFALMASACSLGYCASFFCFGFLSSYFSVQQLILSNVAGTALVSLAFLTVPDEAEMA